MKAIAISIFLYICSCVWFLILPLVSISSGEFKPRGLFVDENALLTHHKVKIGSNANLYEEVHKQLKLSIKNIDSKEEKCQHDLCSTLKKKKLNLSGSVNCKVKTFHSNETINNDSSFITQILIDSPFKSIAYETIGIVIIYNFDCPLPSEILIEKLINDVKSNKWLAKRAYLSMDSLVD
eukprot:gene10410-13985_t